MAGSRWQVDWGLAFGSLPERASFVASPERLRARTAYRDTKLIDTKLIAAMQA